MTQDIVHTLALAVGAFVFIVSVYAIWSLFKHFDERKRAMKRHRSYRDKREQILTITKNKDLRQSFVGKLPPNLHQEMILIINEINRRDKRKRLGILEALQTHHVIDYAMISIALFDNILLIFQGRS